MPQSNNAAYSRHKWKKMQQKTKQEVINSRTILSGAITFALILQKNRLRLSYTCGHKSGAFVLSFGVTPGPIYSQLFLGQQLVFEPRCKKIGLPGSFFEFLSFRNLKPSYKIPGFPRFVLKMFPIKDQKLKCKCDPVVKRIRLKLNERVS